MVLLKVMNKILSTAKSTVGFTLIELLVVIGILGILAAALVATIDPFEQLKKASDANIENAEIEFINATIRYYTINGGFPWYGIDVGGDECAAPIADDLEYELPLTRVSSWATNGVANAGECLDILIDAGELKPSFAGAEGILSEIYVSETGTAVTACYNPGSKAKTEEAATNWMPTPNNGDHPTTALAADDANCAALGGANTECYRCTSG